MRVALTFDAEHSGGPHHRPEVPAEVLDILTSREIRATFFLQGRWAKSAPASAQRMVGDGHLIGSHSYYHVRMDLLTAEGMRDDIRRAQEVIQGVTGIDPRPWFRCPYDAADARVDAELRALGYRRVGWNVAPEDWEPDRSPEQVEEAVVEGVLRHPDGAVVLLHAWPASVPAALPRIVERLGELGARFESVEKLYRDLPER